MLLTLVSATTAQAAGRVAPAQRCRLTVPESPGAKVASSGWTLRKAADGVTNAFTRLSNGNLLAIALRQTSSEEELELVSQGLYDSGIVGCFKVLDARGRLVRGSTNLALLHEATGELGRPSAPTKADTLLTQLKLRPAQLLRRFTALRRHVTLHNAPVLARVDDARYLQQLADRWNTHYYGDR